MYKNQIHTWTIWEAPWFTEGEDFIQAVITQPALVVSVKPVKLFVFLRRQRFYWWQLRSGTRWPRCPCCRWSCRPSTAQTQTQTHRKCSVNADLSHLGQPQRSVENNAEIPHCDSTSVKVIQFSCDNEDSCTKYLQTISTLSKWIGEFVFLLKRMLYSNV